MRLRMNYLACGPCRPVVSSMRRDDVDVWISVKFGFLSSFAHVSWSGAGCRDQGRVAGERSNNGNIQVRGRTIKVDDKIHTRMLTLAVHNASESKHLVFNEYLGATVWVYGVCKTCGHCCMPAVNTSSVPTSIAVILL